MKDDGIEKKLCECGCGRPALRRFIVGHNVRVRLVSKETKEKIRNSTLGKVRSEETREKMGEAKRGELNPMWKGDSITCKTSGRLRAQRIYISLGECQKYGERPAYDRHHKDGNTANNDQDNVLFLCRSCHMKVDGRINNLNQFQEFTVILDHDERGRFVRRRDSAELVQ
jgi:hypothetical protein